MVQFPWKNSRQHRTILAVYAPNSSRENESFWITLASKWDGPNPPPRPDIMLGDTNIVEDSLDRLPIRRDDPGAVSALRGLKRKLGIVDGWRDENPDGIQYTYLQETTGSQSRIDRIYVTPKILRTTREWLVEPSDIHTDHSLVSFHYYDPGQPVHGNGRATIPLWLAKDEKFLKKAKCLVRSAVEEARMVAGGDAETPEKTYPVQEVYHALKVSLHCWAKVRVKDAQPKMRRRIESRKKELKKVVNNKEMPERERVETAAAIETEIRSMHMRHHSTGKDRTHLKYSSENEIVGKLWVNGSKEDATRDPIMALKKPQTESDPNPGLEYNSKKMAEIARDYHEKLQEEGMYNHASDEEEEQTHREVLNTIKKRLSPEQVQTLDSRLTRGEVHVALMGVPNEKAPGVDGYPIEILKALAASPKRPEEWEAEDDMTSILTLTYNEIERVGGRTQFKTRVQGMPQEVEKCFEKMITKFVWNGRMPAVNAETLRLPHEEGGFKILDVRARNEAIDLMKLKQYLTFELRPRWTQIIDHLLSRNIPTTHRVRDADAAQNMFLQSWEAAKQEKKSEAPASIRKMLKTARKYGVRAEPFEPSEDVKAEMPLWHHIGWKKGIRRRNNGARADCLRSTHEVFTVGDAVEFSQREHEPEEQPMSESESSECSWDGNNDRTHTCCEMCTIETLKGCDDMKRCQAECKRLLLGLNEMWRPLAEEEGSDSDSQETRDEEYNRSKCSSRTEMFRVFTAGPQVHKNQGKSRVHTSTTGDINIYTDGSGMNPGYEEARAGVGVWFGPEDERNYSGRVPENLPQTNNSAEALAVLVALQKVPGKENVVIHTDSKFVIDSLTTAREKTENTDWLLQSNKETLEPIISKIRRRRGKTTFKKVKGHSGIKGNEEADRLAGEGAEKPLGDKINLRIPKDARVQGAKLSEMTQALLYKGIRRAKASKTMPRRKTVAH
ncbi:hypothetical protein D9611_007204 [Ephemerocybe angulata]|uniref:ribonuclease H n=1 Tax=Ephemerocybe angulata TaxID=980116 RepID=A0A8H5B0M9_9AGAR|nr:hypothetical protein D9611_007204 [Tulosesus angulatus]